ncbi:MAG: 3-hydroxylacyl-ACP dehydratase [Kiritimatiellae bacterium]|nr:3-hydroxylacyl-ACP dehydratase [Kiritimatiellia bacterium]
MTELAELLPHKAPMILLSGYEEPTADDSVSAYVDVSERSPFFEATLGGVPGCVALEYMAQAMALLVGLDRRRRGLPPAVGFVLGSRRMEVPAPFFRDGARYRVKAVCAYRDDDGFGSFDCEVLDEAGGVAARGTITAFQPDGEITPEKIKELS